ncbi:MAG: hypothetical protein JST19_19000 [Bacteroidetes bacterium]|nr:hypothetical protein [Bacteroidota bacterium]
MAKPNFNTYYFAAVLFGLIIGLVTEDKYIGMLVAIALVLTVAGLRQRYRRR